MLCLLSVGRKAGACGTALGDVIEQFGVGAVRDDHVSSAGGHHPGGPEFGGHSAGTQRRAGSVGPTIIRQCEYNRDNRRNNTFLK